MNNKVVAWYYELADSVIHHIGGSKEYVNWNPHISFIEPCVPEGSIRNLKALTWLDIMKETK